MPGSKTDTAIRFPEKDDQTRRLRNTTSQDRKAVARMQAEGASSKSRVARAQGPGWTPVEQFETTMDKDGNLVPDRAFTDYDKMDKRKEGPGEADDYVAANANFQ